MNSDIYGTVLMVLVIPLVWLGPLVVTAVVSSIYDPAAKLKRVGTGKVINRGVLIFYTLRRWKTMRRVDVCPLCKKRHMRCRVTINTITGRRSHVSLVASRRGYFRSQRAYSI